MVLWAGTTVERMPKIANAEKPVLNTYLLNAWSFLAI